MVVPPKSMFPSSKATEETKGTQCILTAQHHSQAVWMSGLKCSDLERMSA